VKPLHKILWVAVFAVAFAAVESAVVVYLRALYYPEGFSLPLKIFSRNHFWVELVRELATMVMLASVALLTGTNRWQRFAYFLITFGAWDIFFYLWLKVMLNWPSSIFDWDILFLLPVPWIGPVVAPVLVSIVLIVAGWLILLREVSSEQFKPGALVWLLSILGTAVILYSFTSDIDASMRMQIPKPYRYELLILGLLCYLTALSSIVRNQKRQSH